MEYKELKYNGVPELITVREDGKEILYKGKKIHQSLIKSKSTKHSYYQVSIAGIAIYVHHLVARAFIQNPKPISYKIVFHKNAIGTDNHYLNLEWGNPKILAKTFQKERITKDHQRGNSSISYKEALKIAKRLDNGEHANAICEEYGVSEMSIIRIRKRYCQNKVASIRYPKEIKEIVLKLCDKHPSTKVAEITNIPYHTIFRWVKQKQKKPE